MPTTVIDRLDADAVRVLEKNDVGGWTRPAPNLYPHQWSWDAAFIAIGLGWLDTRRACSELEALFRAQWRTGKVPHIVFDPRTPHGHYFPDSSRWGCGACPDAAEGGPPTSGICQPPVHALAALLVWQAARHQSRAQAEEAVDFLRWVYPRLFAWHRYLASVRDPEGSGLVTIVHPWESGTDNSPRWDAPMSKVEVGPDLPPFERADLEHITDATQRPTQVEYDRYVWLVELMKRARYDDREIMVSHPFKAKDALFSGILVAANDALAEIAAIVGADPDEREQIAVWIDTGARGLVAAWDDELGLTVTRDVTNGRGPIRVRTIGGFGGLVADRLEDHHHRRLLETLDSEDFCGHPDLRWPLPPSTSPRELGFDPRSYWRGPQWPVMNWLLGRSLERLGEADRAEEMREFGLEQVAHAGFAEYVEPFTGEPLGSPDQSWTAAVVLDWLRRP